MEYISEYIFSFKISELHLLLSQKNAGLFIFRLLWSHSCLQPRFFSSFTVCAVLSVLGNSRLIHFLFSKPSYHTWAPLPPACSCSTASDLQGLQNGKTLFTLTSLMPTENFILHFCADSGELGTAFKKCT